MKRSTYQKPKVDWRYELVTHLKIGLASMALFATLWIVAEVAMYFDTK